MQLQLLPLSLFTDWRLVNTLVPPTGPRRRLQVLAIALSMAAGMTALPAAAQSLSQLYQSARVFDAGYQSSLLQFDANVARADQARAGLLPSAGLAAGATGTNFDNSNPSVNRTFSNLSATLSAAQPLYRPANRATFDQSFRQIDFSLAQLETAGQDLIVRSSQAYFDVLGAQDTLAFVRAQKAAVAEQLAFARRNFEVGTSTITDTREAQARFDLVGAQEIAAENDLQVKRIALDTLVGRQDSQPLGLRLPVALPALLPLDVNAWVEQSLGAHPSIRQAKSAVAIAELEIAKAEAGGKPTVDAVASYNLNRSPSGSAQSTQSNRSGTANVGVQLNWPLFTGYAVQNRIRETIFLRDKALSDAEAARRNVAQATRSAYFGVLSGQGQVRALEAAELSSQSALDANRLGYQVGVRINIDVLNAQSQLFQTKRDLAQARYSVLLGGLRLRQANGTLTPADLLAIDALLLNAAP